MKIYLIDPEGFSQGFSTGLASLTACAKRGGFDNISVVDFQNYRKKFDERINKIISENPDVVGITVNSFNILNALKIIRLLQEKLPECKFIAGGPGVTSDPKIFLQRTEQLFDAVVYKEGEETFLELLKCFAGSNPEKLGEIKGIAYYNKDNAVIVNPERPLISNLDGLPVPDYESFDSFGKGFGDEPYMILTSRGCPGRCVFCMNPLLNNGMWRGRSPENVINELISAKEKYNIKSFIVRDDNFTHDMNRAEEICDRLIALNFNTSWRCKAAVRADRVRPSLLRKMKQSGCNSLTLGIESGDREIFPLVRKGESLDTITAGIKMIKEAGIEVSVTMVIGLINDSYKSILKSIKFLKDIGVNAHWYPALPFRGTELFNWVEKNGKFLIDCDFIDTFIHRQSKDLVIPFETENFNAQERRKAYYKANISSENFSFIWNDGVVETNRYGDSGKLKRAAVILSKTLRYHPSYFFKALNYLITAAFYGFKEKLKIKIKNQRLKTSPEIMQNNENRERKIKLDVGCGKLKKAGFIGVDIDPESDADIFASATMLPFEDNSVDQVNSYHMGEHLTPPQLEKFFSEAYRVLKSGGTVFAKIDHDWSKKRLFRKDKTHICRHSAKDIRKYVKKFKDIEVKNAIYSSPFSGTLFGFGLYNKIFVRLTK